MSQISYDIMIDNETHTVTFGLSDQDPETDFRIIKHLFEDTGATNIRLTVEHTNISCLSCERK